MDLWFIWICGEFGSEANCLYLSFNFWILFHSFSLRYIWNYSICFGCNILSVVLLCLNLLFVLLIVLDILSDIFFYLNIISDIPSLSDLVLNPPLYLVWILYSVLHYICLKYISVIHHMDTHGYEVIHSIRFVLALIRSYDSFGSIRLD